MIKYSDIRFDCSFYNGYKPCTNGTKCFACYQYMSIGVPAEASRPCLRFHECAPTKERILIIKTGAMGDVLRTTALLPALKIAFPDVPIDGHSF